MVLVWDLCVFEILLPRNLETLGWEVELTPSLIGNCASGSVGIYGNYGYAQMPMGWSHGVHMIIIKKKSYCMCSALIVSSRRTQPHAQEWVSDWSSSMIGHSRRSDKISLWWLDLLIFRSHGSQVTAPFTRVRTVLIVLDHQDHWRIHWTIRRLRVLGIDVVSMIGS